MSAQANENSAARVSAAMWNIRIDAATAEVVAELSRKGVETLLLKGPALSALYPPDAARTYVDGDILVSPANLDAAQHTLEMLGFERVMDDSGMPAWWQEHASSWERERDRGSIDLHRILQGTSADAAAAWARLWRDRVPMNVAGRPANRLSDPALAMYVTLHAAHHGADHQGGLAHLDAALESLDAATWRDASALASELGGTEAFAAGLRLAEAGRELADDLHLPRTSSVRVALMATTPPPVALGFEQLSAAGWRQRLEIMLRKAFPPPGFIRYWWPPAARNGAMLVIGYGYRLVWLAKHGPRGWRAWRSARDTVGR